MEKLVINGVDYVRADSIPAPATSGRAVVVVDRGWIFAGDVEEKNGRIYLHNAVWVFNWKSIGFSKVLEDPKNGNVDIRPMPTVVDIPAGSEIYRCPVPAGWGL